MVTIIEGDLMDVEEGVIAHQVNTRGKMGSGVAKAVRGKYPKAYKLYKDYTDTYGKDILGHTQVVKVGQNLYVANLFGQDNFGYDGKCYTSLEGLERAMVRLRSWMVSKNIQKISLPYKMSSDRGGANWQDVLFLIDKYFGDMECNIIKLKQ